MMTSDNDVKWVLMFPSFEKHTVTVIGDTKTSNSHQPLFDWHVGFRMGLIVCLDFMSNK